MIYTVSAFFIYITAEKKHTIFPFFQMYLPAEVHTVGLAKGFFFL